jgi:hypothetical protein
MGATPGKVFWKTRYFSGCQIPALCSIKPAAIIVDFYEEAAALLLDADRGFVAAAVFPRVR